MEVVWKRHSCSDGMLDNRLAVHCSSLRRGWAQRYRIFRVVQRLRNGAFGHPVNLTLTNIKGLEASNRLSWLLEAVCQWVRRG